MEDRLRRIGFTRAIIKIAQVPPQMEEEPKKGPQAAKKLLLAMATLPAIALLGRSASLATGKMFPKVPTPR